MSKKWMFQGPQGCPNCSSFNNSSSSIREYMLFEEMLEEREKRLKDKEKKPEKPPEGFFAKKKITQREVAIWMFAISPLVGLGQLALLEKLLESFKAVIK